MKTRVRPIQYLWAYHVPGKFCLFGFPMAVLILAYHATGMELGTLREPSVLGHAVLILALSIPLGLLSAAVFISAFLAPFYLRAERLNGGPFAVGDKVYVIAGRNAGEIREVYSNWQSLTVRIWLGEQEEKTFKDVFFTVNLIKIREVEQSHAEATSETAPSAVPEASDA